MINNIDKNIILTSGIPKKSPAFGNALLSTVAASSGFWGWLESNPALYIAGIDLTCSVTPRTVIDYRQNSDYGRETLIREVGSLALMAFVPALVGNSLMKLNDYGGIYVGNNTLNALHKAWQKADPKGKFDVKNPQKHIVEKYVRNIIDNTASLEGEDNWKSLKKEMSEADYDKFISEVADIIIDNKSDTKKRLSELSKKFTEITKTAESIKISNLGEEFSAGIDNLLRDSVAVGKKVFTNSLPNLVDDKIERLSDLLKKRSTLGVSTATLGALSVQYINERITESRTGSKDFSGYRNFGEHHYDQESSTAFNIKKGLAIGATILTTIAAIGGFGKKGFFKSGGLKNLREALEMKDCLSSMNIMKVIFTAMLTGRFAFARDETEFNVTALRDYTTLINLFILGPFVAKGVVHSMDRTLLNGKLKQGSWFTTAKSWLSDLSLKSVKEVRAMWPGNKTKLGVLSTGLMAGVGYAMFALGVGVPYFLNKYVIDKAQENGEQNQGTASFQNFLEKHKSEFGRFGQFNMLNGKKL